MRYFRIVRMLWLFGFLTVSLMFIISIGEDIWMKWYILAAGMLAIHLGEWAYFVSRTKRADCRKYKLHTSRSGFVSALISVVLSIIILIAVGYSIINGADIKSWMPFLSFVPIILLQMVLAYKYDSYLYVFGKEMVNYPTGPYFSSPKDLVTKEDEKTGGLTIECDNFRGVLMGSRGVLTMDAEEKERFLREQNSLILGHKEFCCITIFCCKAPFLLRKELSFCILRHF